MKFKLINDYGLYIMHVTDINNSILINKEIFDRLEKKGELSKSELLQIIQDLNPEEVEKFENILRSRANMEADVKNDINKDILEGKSDFTLCIHATRRCNLNCKYCFGGEDYLPKQEISIDVAKKAIDFMVFDYGKNAKMYTIDLAGSGEPLLRFDFIQEIEKHCENIRNLTGKKVIITFPTNATMLNEKHIRYFQQHPDILYGISIDGDEKDNSNRIYSNGKSAFKDVLQGISITTNEHCGFAVTITKNNENVDEVYDYLYSLGKGDAISTHLVRDFGQSETSLYKIDIDNLLTGYRRLTDQFINQSKMGNYDYIKPLLNGDDIYGGYILSAVRKGMVAQCRCDAGQNRIAVDDKGNLYACSVMNGDKNFCIGNIFDGIHIKKQSKFTKCNVQQSEKCQTCWCKNICRGECMTISYMNTGELYQPNDYMCDIRKRLITLAISFVEYLKAKIPDAHMELVKHIIGTKNNYQTNPAVWAVVNYLNDSSQKVSYHEIADVLENVSQVVGDTNVGPRVKDIEMLVKKYNKGDCAVQIKSLSDLQDVLSTMICCVKIPTGGYEFFIVKKENDSFVIHSLDYSITGIKLTDELIKKGMNIFIGAFEEILK